MTEASSATRPDDAAPSEIGERVTFALRQSGLLGLALLVAGQVTVRLRPDETVDRGFVDTPFLWAIVVWLAVLLFHAFAFERSQMRELEGRPLMASLAIGAMVAAIGLASLDGGSAGRRFVYVLANSVGAVMFWWGLIGLGFLVVRRIRRSG